MVAYEAGWLTLLLPSSQLSSALYLLTWPKLPNLRKSTHLLPGRTLTSCQGRSMIQVRPRVSISKNSTQCKLR
jgi:hypothetical protein